MNHSENNMKITNEDIFNLAIISVPIVVVVAIVAFYAYLYWI